MTRLPRISVVFVTYDRLETLRPTLLSFLASTDYPRDRLELVVADDGSPPEIQAEVRKLPFDKFVLSERNRGIGANVNAGIAAATSEFVLQLQDDWECVGPGDYLLRAFGVLDSFEDVGCVICRPHPARVLRWQQRSSAEDGVRVLKNEPARRVAAVGDGAYTDWPHLKRRAFINAIGPYKEGVKMWDCELDYVRRVNVQTRYSVADIVGLDAFRHIGAELSFNTGPWTGRVTAALDSFAPARPVVDVVRKVKHGWGRLMHCLRQPTR